MNIDEFWQIIDSIHVKSAGDMDRKCALLKAELTVLEVSELREFIDHFDFSDAAAYNWPLWGAAYVMNGGCSDDAFSDFRATLISHGREVYEKALNDPESLVELDFNDEEDICYEGFQYVKSEVAEEVIGQIQKRKICLPNNPSGEEWDEDLLDQLFPKLTAKYSNVGDNNESTLDSKPWWKFW